MCLKSQESGRLDGGFIMERVGCCRRKMPIVPGFVVDARLCPGQGRRPIVEGQKWMLRGVAYSYAIFICDMRALKLQRRIDNPITPHGLVEL